MHKANMRDIVLHTRVRLARNFAELPFPAAMRGEDGAKSQFIAADALAHSRIGQQYAMYRIYDLEDTKKRALVESRLISNDLLWAGEYAAILLRRDESVCVMINEEDHLRIHALQAGNALEETAAMACEVDDAIGASALYAFDTELGYITSNPANLGTGMRASCLLHLPSLDRSGAMPALIQETSKRKLTLKPAYQEGKEARGQLYVIASQNSLGQTEQGMLETVWDMIIEIAGRERASRELQLLEEDSKLDDAFMRSYGIIRYARRIGEAEWINRWSDVRFAVLAGMLPIELDRLDRLLTDAKPAHLELAAGKDLSPVERDIQRAKIVREALGA